MTYLNQSETCEPLPESREAGSKLKQGPRNIITFGPNFIKKGPKKTNVHGIVSKYREKVPCGEIRGGPHDNKKQTAFFIWPKHQQD